MKKRELLCNCSITGNRDNGVMSVTIA